MDAFSKKMRLDGKYYLTRWMIMGAILFGLIALFLSPAIILLNLHVESNGMVKEEICAHWEDGPDPQTQYCIANKTEDFPWYEVVQGGVRNSIFIGAIIGAPHPSV